MAWRTCSLMLIHRRYRCGAALANHPDPRCAQRGQRIGKKTPAQSSESDQLRRTGWIGVNRTSMGRWERNAGNASPKSCVKMAQNEAKMCAKASPLAQLSQCGGFIQVIHYT